MKVASIVTIIALTAACSLSAQVLNHRYSFETDASDSVGGAHGTLVNGATVDGGQLVLAGGADTSVGNGQHVSLPGSAIAINTYSAVTMEVWFTPSTEIAGTWVQLVSFGRHYNPDNEGENNWEGWQYLMFQPGREDGVARAAISAASGGDPEVGVNHTEEIADGLLHHAVITVDPFELSFYLDGTLVGTTDTEIPSLAALSNEQALLGASVWQFDDTFGGTVDDFRIWDGAFTAAQVSDSFALGANQVIPEPSTYAIIFGGLVLALAAYRRRLKRG